MKGKRTSCDRTVTHGRHTGTGLTALSNLVVREVRGSETHVKRRVWLLLAGTGAGDYLPDSRARLRRCMPSCRKRSTRCSGSCRRCRISGLRARSRPRRPRSRRNRLSRRNKRSKAQQAQNIPANIPPNNYAAHMPMLTNEPYSPPQSTARDDIWPGCSLRRQGAVRQRNEVLSGASDLDFGTIPSQMWLLDGEGQPRIERRAEPHPVQGVGRDRPDPPRQGLLRNGLWRRCSDGELP